MSLDTIKTQTIAKFKNPVYAVYFMVDNNANGVIEYLANKAGFSSIFTGTVQESKPKAREIILDWYKNQESSKILDLLNNVQYLNEGDENTMDYTKGFRDYFVENTPTGAVNTENRSNIAGREGDFSWDGLFAGLGAGLTAYSSFGSNSQQGTSGDYNAANDAAAAEAKKSKTWMWILGVVGGLALIGIVIVIVKRSKKN